MSNVGENFKVRPVVLYGPVEKYGYNTSWIQLRVGVYNCNPDHETYRAKNMPFDLKLIV